MNSRYYLYRMGDFQETNELDQQYGRFQGYYCLDRGANLDTPFFGMIVGGFLRPVGLENFPTDFRAVLLVLDLP